MTYLHQIHFSFIHHCLCPISLSLSLSLFSSFFLSEKKREEDVSGFNTLAAAVKQGILFFFFSFLVLFLLPLCHYSSFFNFLFPQFYKIPFECVFLFKDPKYNSRVQNALTRSLITRKKIICRNYLSFPKELILLEKIKYIDIGVWNLYCVCASTRYKHKSTRTGGYSVNSYVPNTFCCHKLDFSNSAARRKTRK